MKQDTKLKIPLIKSGRFCGKMSVELQENDTSCLLIVNSEEIKNARYSGDDFFRAFGEVRRDLAKSGITPAVFAAHADVFPGGLASESSNGLVAYRYSEGAEMIPVEIFSEVPPEEYSELTTIDEQKNRRRGAIRARRQRL